MLSGHCNKLLTFNEKYPHLILNISQMKQHLKNHFESNFQILNISQTIHLENGNDINI
jgi:hypothetical protein